MQIVLCDLFFKEKILPLPTNIKVFSINYIERFQDCWRANYESQTDSEKYFKNNQIIKFPIKLY